MMQVSRREMLAAAAWLCLPASLTRAETRADALLYTGVNLAGGEFGALPGVYGREYVYPSLDNVTYFARLGFNCVRLPFKWERLQPDIGAPFEPGDWTRVSSLVSAATQAGITIVLDPHNYAKRRLRGDGWSREHGIGSREVPAASFADFWRRLAGPFKGNPRVIFGLMNEPADIAVGSWLPIANAAIAAIRETGAPNLVLVPGVAYTGAQSWLSSGNVKMRGVHDPAQHFAFEVHQYFDRDSSGITAQTVSPEIGAERIRAFQDWARAGRFKAFLGEFNGARTAEGLAALDGICREMAKNSDVWLGWTAWAGGPRWPRGDMFNLEPVPGHDPREQTRVLMNYVRRRA